MSLELIINNDIKTAMKAKEDVTLRGLRAIKSAILLAKTAEGAPENISTEDEIKLLSKLVKQRRDSLTIYEQQQRPDLAAKEAEEIAIIERYLPKQLSPDELQTEIKAIIAQLGATSAKDMGKVMGVANKQLAGIADGKQIAALVKTLLT
ncbi:MAG: GatB/YqeY domain-containing protein [Sphingobacteriales bacterium]|jgi:uncharacterized protein YqeY|nr:GatB/YqeY domain-containing protein [Sphingobacteriales bacterium]